MSAPPVPEARDIAGTIYLDFNATTPVDPEVLEAMLPFLRGTFGNPSSDSPLGRAARAAIDGARAEVAALIGAHPDEILFTGGGTEASNLAIRGAVVGDRSVGRHHRDRAPGHRGLLRPPRGAGKPRAPRSRPVLTARSRRGR